MPMPEEKNFVTDEAESDEKEIDKKFAGAGFRGCFNWLLILIILGLLLALLWPVKAPPRKTEILLPAIKYKVSRKIEAVVLGKRKIAGMRLKRSFRGNYVLVRLALKNSKRKIASLYFENFKLIVKQGKLTKEVMVYPATMELKGGYWGKAVLPEQELNLRLLFLVPGEGKIEALRVYDPSWRSSKYKDMRVSL